MKSKSTFGQDERVIARFCNVIYWKVLFEDEK